MHLDKPTKITFGLALLLAIILLIFFGYVLPVMVITGGKEAHAAPAKNLVAQQFDASSCVLGAVATHLNYRTGAPDYTARGLALAYTAKYGASNWYQDGNTSHQAQDLVTYAGFTPVYGKLTGAADPVGRMKSLAYYKKYPVVFLGGAPEHAIVLIGANNDTILIGDPLDGSLHTENAYSLYAKLDPEKWVFYTQ